MKCSFVRVHYKIHLENGICGFKLNRHAEPLMQNKINWYKVTQLVTNKRLYVVKALVSNTNCVRKFITT